LKLAPHEIHVWLAFDHEIDDPEVLRAYEALLSPEERVARARLRAPHLPRQYLVTRGLLRTLLSTYAPGTPPADWRFTTAENGKPTLAPEFASGGIHFNLAHTAGLAAVALARQPTLGVDVENMASRGPPLGVASRYFTAHEARALEQLSERDRRQRFFALWTLKESWLKATGEGLAGGLDQVSFSFVDTRFASGVALANDDAARWCFWQAMVSKDHLLALAVRCEQPGQVAQVFRSTPGPHLSGTRMADPRLVAQHSDQEQRPQT
jgi:4'-phosphopantetheinyl transferase